MCRDRSTTWNEFSEIIKVGKKRALCKRCDADVVPNVDRMRDHLKKCVPPKSSRQPQESEVTEIDVSAVDSQQGASGTQPPPQPAVPAKKLKQSTISVSTVSARKQELADLQLIRMLIATNCSFLTANNKQLKAYATLLRPGIAVPDRRRVGGELLDQIYIEEKEKVVSKIRGLCGTLCLDGWSTVPNEPVIGVSITVAGASYLVNTIDITSTPHTTDNLVELLTHELVQCSEVWQIRIGSVVTDSAANMAKMCHDIKQVKPEIHVVGCQTHCANLLAKDFLDTREMKAVVPKIVTVLKFLRNVHAATAALKEKKIPKPPLPCDTRWNTHLDCFRYFVAQWSNIVCIVNNLKSSSDPIYRYMEEISLKRAASDAIEFLQPVGIALDLFQKDDCLLADCMEIWQKVRDSTPDLYMEKLTNRLEKTISPVMYAANLLGHRYSGRLLTPIETGKAMSYLEKTDAEILGDVRNFMARHPPFLQQYFEGHLNVNSTVWWKSGRQLGFPEKLIDVAERLLSIVPASAGLERHFSTLGMSYGKLRASLGVEKAGKLAFLYKQLNA